MDIIYSRKDVRFNKIKNVASIHKQFKSINELLNIKNTLNYNKNNKNNKISYTYNKNDDVKTNSNT